MAAESVSSLTLLILVFLEPSPGSCVEQVLLESDPDTSVPVCPGVPLNFTCNATELSSLSWYRDGIPSFFSIDILGGTTGTPPDGLQVVVNSIQRTGSLADFISTLIVDNATLVGGSEICCGLLGLFDDCINVTLKTISPPTITSIREETVRSVTITLEGSECFMNYTIQYGNETVSTSTGGALSVVIEDTVLCSVAPVTFNVTAVLGDDSMISGSESDFNVTGETLSTITGVNVTGPNITWMEPDPSCDCVERYDIESNGAVVGSSPCGNPQYECEECRCEELNLTVTPVLRNGIRVESSRSDPVIVGEVFLVPSIDAFFTCLEAAEITVIVDSELPEGITREVTYGLTSDGLNVTVSESIFQNGRATVELSYDEYMNKEVSICVTYRSGPCENAASTIVRVENIINRTTDDGDITSAEVTVFFNDCNKGSESNGRSVRATDGSSNLMIMIQAFEASDPETPVFDKPIEAHFPESSLRHQQLLEDLQPNTNYTYNVRVVRTMDNAMIGVPANDSVETENASSERTGLIIGDALLALIYIIAVAVAVVLILLTWWKHRTRVSLKWWQLVILVCGVVLFVVSIILLILVIVELSEDIVEEVEDGGTIGLVAASYIISAVTAVLWIVLIFLAPKWITGHSLFEKSGDKIPSQRPPVYEEVTERGGIPVRENAAYGPVPPPARIELRENAAYGPVPPPERIELKENAAYGPVPPPARIELRENVAYGPVQH